MPDPNTLPELDFTQLEIVDEPVPVPCRHTQFNVTMDMRHTEAGYEARLRMNCSACGQKFVFSGLSAEPSDVRPHVELDGTQVHLPLGIYYG